MDFTTYLQIISMNQCIYYTFKHCSIRIIRHFNSAVTNLTPCFLGIISHKISSCLQQCDKTASIFLIIKYIHYS